MNNYDLNKLKRSVVAKAWTAEKMKLCKGVGQRDWRDRQQKEILLFNRNPAYVAQFVRIGDSEEKIQVQFVESSIEYLEAHKPEGGAQYGVIDTVDYCVIPGASLAEVKLSEPKYLGFFKTHKELFIGHDIGYGIKVTLGKKRRLNREKFGLPDTNNKTNMEQSISKQERKDKYGF